MGSTLRAYVMFTLSFGIRRRWLWSLEIAIPFRLGFWSIFLDSKREMRVKRVFFSVSEFECILVERSEEVVDLERFFFILCVVRHIKYEQCIII